MVLKALHIIPYDGVGGVEHAAATAEGAEAQGVRLTRMFIFDSVRDRTKRAATFDPLTFWNAAGRIMQEKPDLVILSLWRAVIVGALARLRGFRAPMVLFLHNSRDAHRVDRWVTQAAARRVHEVWADSAATLETRLPFHPARTRVISFLTEHREPVRPADPDPEPRFVFWGRLADQKDPLRMLELFRRIHERRPDARLDIFGPDGGLESALCDAIEAAKLSAAVTLHGPTDPQTLADHARSASFYLQTSRYEGMALSVIEAMQYGLVPVVTPVGEIANYTQPNENAIWVKNGAGSEHAAVDAVIDLINSPQDWRSYRRSAIERWREPVLYKDDLLLAASKALAD